MNLEKNPKTRNLQRQLLRLEDRLYGRGFPTMRRIKQATIYHCGPAVLEALFSYLGIKVNQRSLVRSLRAQKKIVMYGLSVGELARAVKAASHGNFSFWRKSNATISDLDRAVNKFKYPVGVEWQGVFYEFEDEDSGHYGVVTKIDKKTGEMRISDSFHAFAGVDRKFKIKEFYKRWWDQNDILVSGTTRRRRITDNRVMFVITPKRETWPKRLGMVRG